MSGFIKLHRRVLDHWLGTSPEYLGYWISLLFMANWKDTQVVRHGHVVTVPRGSILIAERTLAKKWDVSPSKVHRVIKLFIKENMLIRTNTETSLKLIKVCNYEKFQGRDNEPETATKQTESNREYHHKKGKEGKEEDSHTTREMPTFGLMDEVFAMEGGVLSITSEKELGRWSEIFGGATALYVALAGFTPNKSYRHGDTLDAHARHYLSRKSAALSLMRQKADQKHREQKYRGSFSEKMSTK